MQPSRIATRSTELAIAVDSIGDSDATLIGATLDGGHLTLDGNGPYVDLPNGVVSAANEQTIEAWLTWNGGNAWQRMSSGPKRRSEHRPTWQRRRIKSGDRGREVDTPRSPPFFV